VVAGDRSAITATVLFVVGVLAVLYWPPVAEALGSVFT
jgi:phosphotransferase system  glucose/maltose/N-acetylglucosamine-specific IIC component